MSGHDELRAIDLVIGDERIMSELEVGAMALEAFDLFWPKTNQAAPRGGRREGKRGFTQAAVTRAIKGVEATGVEIGKVEVTRDKITVEVGKPEQPENVLPFDEWKARHAR